MEPDNILALSAFVTAVVGAIISIISSRKSAKRDEVQLLREEVTRLQGRIAGLEIEKDKWQQKYDTIHGELILLREENSSLKQSLARLQARVSELETEKSTWKQGYDDLNDEVYILGAENATLKGLIETCEICPQKDERLAILKNKGIGEKPKTE